MRCALIQRLSALSSDAITGPLSDSTLVARPLGHCVQKNFASVDYVARHGTPRTLADLAQHRLVHYVPTLGGRSPGFEYVEAASGETRTVPTAGALTVNNSEAYEAARLAGVGLIQAPEMGLAPMVAAGRLVEVLPEFRAPPMAVSLLYANRRHLPKRVQAFMDWVAQVMRPFLLAGS